MALLEEIENSLLKVGPGGVAPIEKWNPPLSGNIDIIIKANGDWYHEGIKFLRKPLVKLFSSILKKEDNDYYLVTPVEKWKITVEEFPLLVIDMDIHENHNDETQQLIQFKTATDDIFNLSHNHPLEVSRNSNGALRPSVRVRSNLHALIHRNVFYHLADIAKNVDGVFGIWSDGVFLKLE